jgi:sugar phosphate isomerase/epimerase
MKLGVLTVLSGDRSLEEVLDRALELGLDADELVGANFDPSHLFRQGIDPIEAACGLGRGGTIVHAHAKDTYVDRANVARNGVLDTTRYDRIIDRAWTFGTVGNRHGEALWRELVSTLRAPGYDDVLSIDHEDMLASLDEAWSSRSGLLRSVLLREPAGEMWWS